MTTIRDLQRQKTELLDRYYAARLEEVVEQLRAEAARQAEAEKFPWKGEFRRREEIEYFYAERRRWDRRFLFDMFALILVLGAMAYGASWGVKIMLPLPPEAASAAR